MAGQQRTSLPYPRRKTKSPNLSLGVPHNVPMTSQRRRGSLGAATPQGRTITKANLIKPADLPSPSICQQQPLTALGASAIKSRSFRTRLSAGNHALSHSSPDDQPDSYAVALRSNAAAAQRSKIIYDSCVTSSESSNDLPDGVRNVRRSFSWTSVTAEPARAEVAEITYQQGDSSGQNAYFESVGLTVLEDG